MIWQEVLKRLVNSKGTQRFPLLVYKVEPPSAQGIPEGLPCSDGIRDFYRVCDGGIIDDFRFSSARELVKLNEFWKEMLDEYYPDGSAPLSRQHLVLGTDGAGAPIIWDSSEDQMSTFWFKGGDWEPFKKSFEEFMRHYLVDYEPEEDDDLWYQALKQLRPETQPCDPP